MGAVTVVKVPAPYTRNPKHLEVGEDIMAANITVMGQVKDGMGGLKESQTAFRKHWKETGDALINVSEGKDKDDVRPAYVHQSYPTMRYHADGREAVCEDLAEVEALELKGFRKQPFAKAQVAMEDPKTEKAMLQKELREKDGQISILTEQLTKQGDMLQELMNRMKSVEDKKTK